MNFKYDCGPYTIFKSNGLPEDCYLFSKFGKLDGYRCVFGFVYDTNLSMFPIQFNIAELGNDMLERHLIKIHRIHYFNNTNDLEEFLISIGDKIKEYYLFS